MIHKRIYNRAREWQLSFVYSILSKRISFNPQDAYIICGDPRGGTTWLAELISQLPDTALLWEPLAVSKVKEVESLGFQWRQFIDEHAEWQEAKQLFSQILGGHLLSTYLCQRTTPSQLKSAKHLLVKFCRANQLLPWITNQFKFSFAPIYLIRHPCAVIASQMKQGGWKHVTGKFNIEDIQQPAHKAHEDFLLKIDSVEKKLAATWCLCNTVPLNHSSNNINWITITYESLVLDGKMELKRIEDRWGVEFPLQIYSQLSEASATTISNSPIIKGKHMEQLTHWQKMLTTKQIENVLSVLEYFQVDLYNASSLPTQAFR